MTLREVCRLLLTTALSNREVGRAAGIAGSTASRYRLRLEEEGLDWLGLDALTDRTLKGRLNLGRRNARRAIIEPDFGYVPNKLLLEKMQIDAAMLDFTMFASELQSDYDEPDQGQFSRVRICCHIDPYSSVILGFGLELLPEASAQYRDHGS